MPGNRSKEEKCPAERNRPAVRGHSMRGGEKMRPFRSAAPAALPLRLRLALTGALCSNPLPGFAAANRKNHRFCAVVSVGGEKGIRTLDTISSIHDFQSCALDQLSHLSMGCSGRVHLFGTHSLFWTLSALKDRLYIIINLGPVVKRKSLP